MAVQKANLGKFVREMEEETGTKLFLRMVERRERGVGWLYWVAYEDHYQLTPILRASALWDYLQAYQKGWRDRGRQQQKLGRWAVEALTPPAPTRKGGV
jgi:hypothetical protein